MYKYINQIICYLDAIVKYIGGYIVEQQKRIEAWIEAFRVFLQQLKDFKIIFDLMIDYNASCDKCSTSRFSLFELLLKLFLVIPSPPIIVFPKWPDIYFDLSDIQAGIKIMWPDLRFRPEPIILPKIPRIYLPSMPSLTIVLPEIPLLPEPPALGNLPDLPPLPLPSLPNLPPPPKLPKIFPASIKVAINILKKILRILCLLKKGLIFVPESGLKAQIEQMTERSLSLLLPFDLGLNIQFPPMGIDWGVPSKIEIASHLNFQLELDFILKFVQNIADKSNSITTDFVKWLNDKIKELAEEAQKAADAANNAANQSLGEDTTVNLTKYAPQTTPKDAIKMIGQLLPDLAGPAKELFDLNDQIAKEAAEYKKYALEIKDFHLKATQRFLTKDDPILNRPLAAVKNGINSEIPAQFEMQTKAMNLRKGLIAYVENRSAMDTALNSTTDFSEFGRLIAMDTPLTKYLPETELPAQNNKMVAAIDPIIKSSTGSQIQNGLSVGDTSQGRLIADIGDSIQKDIKSKLHLLADVSIPDVPTTPGMQSSSAVPIGIFITDPATGVSERLINYTAESDSQSQLAFMDVNNDGDNDIIFAMGGNIYMKENYKIADTSNPKYLRTINRITPKVAELNDYLPKAPAVNGFSTTYSNNKSAELSWDYAGDNAGGYEIIFNTAPDAFDQNLGIKVHKVGAIPGGEPVAEDVPADAVFQPETIEIPQLLAESIYGNVTFDGAERIFLKAGDTPAKVISPQIVHTLGDSEISINNNGSDEGGIKLPANRTFVIPSEYTETVEISVISGSVEIINPRIQQQGQTLQNGMLLDFNDVIMTESGTGATVRINSGPYISIRNGEDLLLKQLNTPENPSVELILPNGFYYSKIYAFDKAGFRSTVSYLNLMAPSICSDKQDPVINAGPIERSVSIYKSLKIDTSSSFDANGEILAYWLDTDTSVDSDGDGDPTNDKNMAGDLDPKTDFDGDGITFNDRDNPVFNLKPYTDLNKRQVAANIIDESNNRSSQLINITVFVPDVILADSTATEGVIRGVIDPIDNMIPISLIRNRKGSISKIITAKAKNDGKYYTDNIGEFAADDLKLIDTVVIKNAKGEVIGEINPETGRIILYDKNYSTEVLPAEKPLLPTRVIVKDKDGNVLATIFLVPDVNTDTTVDDPNLPYDSGTTAIFNGVHSKDIDVLDDFEFSKIAMDDANFPGATEIVEKSTQKRAAILDTGGNFYAIDNRLSLQLKSAVDLDAPMAVEIVFTADVNTPPKVIGEFVVSVHSDKGVQVLPADKYNLMAVKASSKDPMFDTDHDGIPDQWEITYGLNPKDPADAQLDSDGDGLSNLEEYKVGSNPLNPDSNGNGMNDALELINGHNPNDKTASPFTDVKEDNQYYKSIMNLFLRNVLKGIPAGRGLLFGPGQPFTRAEFAKLMLDIFCIIPRKEAYEAPSAFTDIKYTLGKNPWYYASVKEAYFQGFITGYLGEIDPATGKSPFKADNTISKAEVVKVILEALQRRGIIDMGRVPVIEPWYKPYMEISLDLKPYLKEKSFLRQVYILTPEEAKNPEEPITRALFIAMADRVLTAYDCSAVDDDGDGMPSYWERLHGLNPNDPSDANDDPDKDGLTNLQEYQHGSDPWNFDTDGGGVGDGTEVKTGTNPLNPKDDKVDSDNDGIPDKSEIANGLNPKNPADANNDPDGDGITNLQEYGHNTDPNNPDTDGDGLKDGAEVNIHETDPTNPDTDSGGINDGTEVKTGTNPIDPKDDNFDVKSELTEGPYAVLPACLSCPCPATIEHTADLIPGDIIFANISSYDDLTIFAQSNKITIQTVPKL
jgi:hypothetical protein